ICIGSGVSANCNTLSATNGVLGLFSANAGGNRVQVGFDPSTLATVASKGVITWNGTVTVSVSGFPDLDIAVTLNVGNNSTFTVTWNGAAVPSTGIIVNAGAGAGAVTSIILAATKTVGFTASSNQSWLTASPNTGIVGPAANQQQATINLTVNAFGLQTGTHNATVTIGSNGAVAATVPVAVNVGTNSGLILNPNPMNFTYLFSGGSFPSGQTQSLNISGASPTSTFTVASPVSWLSVNGTSSVSNATQLVFSVNPIPLLPQTGTFSTLVTIQNSNGPAAMLTVNLTISQNS